MCSGSTATVLISLIVQCRRVKNAAPYYFQNRHFNRKVTMRGLSYLQLYLPTLWRYTNAVIIIIIIFYTLWCKNPEG